METFNHIGFIGVLMHWRDLHDARDRLVSTLIAKLRSEGYETMTELTTVYLNGQRLRVHPDDAASLRTDEAQRAMNADPFAYVVGLPVSRDFALRFIDEHRDEYRAMLEAVQREHAAGEYEPPLSKAAAVVPMAVRRSDRDG